MRCNVCGREFGRGETCSFCGTDKVVGLGNYTGYDVNNVSIRKATQQHYNPNTPQSIGAQRVVDISNSSTPEVGLVLCYKCKEVVPIKSDFCPSCGIKLNQECPKCGNVFSSQYAFCNRCGVHIEEYIAEQKRQAELKAEAERIRQQKELEERKQKEAIRKRQEEEERLRKQKEERENAERKRLELIRQAEEERLRKQQEEREKEEREHQKLLRQKEARRERQMMRKEIEEFEKSSLYQESNKYFSSMKRFVRFRIFILRCLGIFSLLASVFLLYDQFYSNSPFVPLYHYDYIWLGRALSSYIISAITTATLFILGVVCIVMSIIFEKKKFYYKKYFKKRVRSIEVEDLIRYRMTLDEKSRWNILKDIRAESTKYKTEKLQAFKESSLYKESYKKISSMRRFVRFRIFILKCLCLIITICGIMMLCMIEEVDDASLEGVLIIGGVILVDAGVGLLLAFVVTYPKIKDRYRRKYLNKKTHTPEVVRILKYCAYSKRNIKCLLESYIKGIYKREIDKWEIWDSNEFVND